MYRFSFKLKISERGRPSAAAIAKARHWRSARGGSQVTRRFAPLLLLFLLLGSGCFLATGQSTATAAEAREHHNPSRKFKPAVPIAPLFPNGPPDLTADVVLDKRLAAGALKRFCSVEAVKFEMPALTRSGMLEMTCFTA